MTAPGVAVVVPTVGRPALHRLLTALGAAAGPAPPEIVVVDDRQDTRIPLPLPELPQVPQVLVLRSGGRGPAAARNIGWRASSGEWVCFLDDDVEPGPAWCAQLEVDLKTAATTAGAVGSQGVIAVPAPAGRRPSDQERRTLRLAEAQWITADMAYRRSALVDSGGFDERFPRAYREDADLALRLTDAGSTILAGTRETRHPIDTGSASPWSSLRAQRGNRDDALMRRKHGRRWRAAIGEGRGRLPAHLLSVAAAATAVGGVLARSRRAGGAGLVSWLALTADFAARRIAAGPRTTAEITAMILTSALIPPVAVAQRALGAWRFRGARAEPVLAVLLDRDDTLIHDGPYLNDPDRVVPLPGAAAALHRLRSHGMRLGVVSNQSGVAKGLISAEQLTAVNARVDRLLGPFDTWQICRHDDGDGCTCRKPAPGLVTAAAAALGVPARRCVMIGDTGGDVTAGLAADAHAILVPTERTRAEEVRAARADAAVADTLGDAVTLVLERMR